MLLCASVFFVHEVLVSKAKQWSIGEELSRLKTLPDGKSNLTKRVVLKLVIKGVVMRPARRLCSKPLERRRFGSASVVNCPYKGSAFSMQGSSLMLKISFLVQVNLFSCATKGYFTFNCNHYFFSLVIIILIG